VGTDRFAVGDLDAGVADAAKGIPTRHEKYATPDEEGLGELLHRTLRITTILVKPNPQSGTDYNVPKLSLPIAERVD
jgi:hypothetical protein